MVFDDHLKLQINFPEAEEKSSSYFFRSLGLSNPPLAPHNNQYNREDNCIEQANKSAALPIFVFMVAQVSPRMTFLSK